MSIKCPFKCISNPKNRKVVRFGQYFRHSDRKWIQRHKCCTCQRHFSTATFSSCYKQNKRQLNPKIRKLLVSGVSLRRTALLLRTHQITVARKLAFLGLQARKQNLKRRMNIEKIKHFQFDDLETIEHSKLKPLSVAIAVEHHTRRIIGFEVARMPAKGRLANRSLKKYGPRRDERPQARDRLFRRVKSCIEPTAEIDSDESPHYPRLVKMHFPDSLYIRHKSQRGSSTGQGELKQIKFDPLFSINHTFAMLRANINRLFRKTWCTTKKIQPLIDHIEIYVNFHNNSLI